MSTTSHTSHGKMSDMSLVSIVAANPAAFQLRIDELIGIHLDAMNYPSNFAPQRRNLWLSAIQHQDFRCHLALVHPEGTPADAADLSQKCAGVCFSFRGTPGNWWDQQISRGLKEAGSSTQQIESVLASYAELSEIHVAPQMQKHGIGRVLLERHLSAIEQQHVMLSTPEVPGEDNGAWRLYRSLGFQDVLRNFRFPADSRPFAILSKAL